MTSPSGPGGPRELSLQQRRSISRAAKRRNPKPLYVGLSLVAILVIWLGAWTIESTLNSGKTARGIEVAGQEVGRLSDTELDVALDLITANYGATPVTIQLPDSTIETTAAQVGLTIDRTATRAAITDVGEGSALTRPFAWISRWTANDQIPLKFASTALDQASALADLKTSVESNPINPTVDFINGEFTLIPGIPGMGIDPATVLAQLVPAAASGANPIVVIAEPGQKAPNLSDATLQVAINELNDRTATGLTISAGGESTQQLGSGEIRSWLAIDVDDTGTISTSINAPKANAAIAERFSGVGDLGAPGAITIVDGKPTAEAGEPGTACCDENTADLIFEAIESGKGQVRLELIYVDRGDDYLQELGIIEVVGEFTTNHACCQGRVENIQRLGELLRGKIIMPDETLSVNNYIGRRTVEKGFTTGGVIYGGVISSDVGGGISQFITTFFNAVFYAGLDYESYQAHTIYISRYPYGREATISYPAPDFEIRNTSQYPVLIWSTWTDTSISVQLYSTQHIEVVESGPVSWAEGSCTRATTFRERTYPDGTVVEDSVTALYQPEEGIGCNGLPTSGATPTPEPTEEPTPEPTPEETPTPEPTVEETPTVEPTVEPTATVEPTVEPTATVEPTVEP